MSELLHDQCCKGVWEIKQMIFLGTIVGNVKKKKKRTTTTKPIVNELGKNTMSQSADQWCKNMVGTMALLYRAEEERRILLAHGQILHLLCLKVSFLFPPVLSPDVVWHEETLVVKQRGQDHQRSWCSDNSYLIALTESASVSVQPFSPHFSVTLWVLCCRTYLTPFYRWAISLESDKWDVEVRTT